VDLFEVEYPHLLTLLGQAAVFPIDAADQPALGAPASALPVTKIHLRDSRYAHDKAPLLEGCACYTCANHTRAYLHHLLNVHEMTAPILLDLHNLHHYARFMAAIRSSLAAPAAAHGGGSSSFEAFRAQFLARFLPPASVTALHPSGPVHAHQVGRALLGPFAPVLAAVGPFVLRHILPKDEPAVAALVRRVLASFGVDGSAPGYATQDPELDYMHRAYETHNLPAQQQGQVGENDMVDAPPAPTAAAAAASSSGPVGAPVAAPLRSAYFVVTRSADDSAVVGGAGFAALEGSDPAAGVAELRKMYLDPVARGQGVGQALLDQIFPAARAAGFSSIYLETLPNMEAALAIYKKNGFVRLDAPMGNTGHTACGERFLKQL
jgi:GNAT superfamily N-acetyltransferase